jgi:hypothetical protein
LDQAGRKPEPMQSQDSATAPVLLTAPPPSCVGHSCMLSIRYAKVSPLTPQYCQHGNVTEYEPKRHGKSAKFVCI